ncbi:MULTISPECIES: response regulator transcription factor [Thermomonospora]|uniref:Two component transcriptional regulator, LuxR family n=1 Tax=Thermomonospora curvata (strain ATCC 19995 / DSM 43183 / JCM 3096 / KCTC 9072 / NBRC 15933 / NCIMB 10081 / Henssen B9) TaxID=471852 RepID=D1A6R2_THECD|nr:MULTISPECIES: response regulator transcription factor [Thermomonospora]ACY98316.1 two component transcriptional regulator, LuxR family [Thermomonospora curvata DSM 43183]PKK13482.1 MAG: DNA-binding response regulator [Thermomonospora sp. CIF 1]
MLRVMLAEDMHIVRAAIVALLDLEEDIRVVADVASGDEIMRVARAYRPDVAIIDIDLPVVDGITAARMIHQELPETRTLILTSLGRPGTLRKALTAKVGGFIMKDAPPGELTEAIRTVAAGRRYIDGQLALAAWDSGECPLTERELEVLRIAASGSGVEEIAATLFLTTGTVRNYLASAVSKLNARNRIDAIRIAHASDWL